MTSSKFRVCWEYLQRFCCDSCSPGRTWCATFDHTTVTEQRNVVYALSNRVACDRGSTIVGIIVGTLCFILTPLPYVDDKMRAAVVLACLVHLFMPVPFFSSTCV